MPHRDLRVSLWLGAVGAFSFLNACGSGGQGDRRYPNPTGLVVRQESLYYDVQGRTREELRLALLTQGPKLADWPLFAYTEWELRWRYRPPVRYASVRAGAIPSRCRLEPEEVELTIRTMLPRWLPANGADSTLRDDWNMFLAALGHHEHGHHDLGIQAGRAVLVALKTLPSLPCGSIRAQADTAARATIGRYRQRNAEYDNQTEYGRTQGAVWPPP